MAVRSIAVGACKGFTQNQHPSREAKKLSNFSLFLGCALPCYRNCFPCYFLSVSGQEIPKNRLRPGIRHDFPSRNRDFPVFFPVLAAEDRVRPGTPSASGCCSRAFAIPVNFSVSREFAAPDQFASDCGVSQSRRSRERRRASWQSKPPLLLLCWTCRRHPLRS